MIKGRSFRKRPVVIQAWQFNGVLGSEEKPDWLVEKFKTGAVTYLLDKHVPAFMRIKTLEGVMTAEMGDWIILGVKGEVYSCKPDIFGMTYESVEG